jgi:hypothetical protein
LSKKIEIYNISYCILYIAQTNLPFKRMIGLHSLPISFKEVFTTTTINVHVNPFHTIMQFIETTRPSLASHFGINENEIEIIESGQYVNGNMPESAQALVPESRRLCDIWGPQLSNLGFYIRRKNFVYPQIERRIREREENQSQTSNIDISSVIGECPICLESTTITRRYSCSHGVCATCYGRCQVASITVCSLCRAH